MNNEHGLPAGTSGHVQLEAWRTDRAFEDWLCAGLQRHAVALSDVDRRWAFEGIVLDDGDMEIELVAHVPDRQGLRRAVRGALSHWTLAWGPNSLTNLASLMILARRLRPAGLVSILEGLWSRRAYGDSDPNWAESELDLVHTACELAATGDEDAHRFLDELRNDQVRWRVDFADLWLRAKIRSPHTQITPLRWDEGLRLFQKDFDHLINHLDFPFAVYLDTVLSDVSGLGRIAADIETWTAPHWPWFLSYLLLDENRPLRLERHGNRYVLVRVIGGGLPRAEIDGELSVPAADGNLSLPTRLSLWETLYKTVDPGYDLLDKGVKQAIRDGGDPAALEAFDRARRLVGPPERGILR